MRSGRVHDQLGAMTLAAAGCPLLVRITGGSAAVAWLADRFAGRVDGENQHDP